MCNKFQIYKNFELNFQKLDTKGSRSQDLKIQYYFLKMLLQKCQILKNWWVPSLKKFKINDILQKKIEMCDKFQYSKSPHQISKILILNSWSQVLKKSVVDIKNVIKEINLCFSNVQ